MHHAGPLIALKGQLVLLLILDMLFILVSEALTNLLFVQRRHCHRQSGCSSKILNGAVYWFLETLNQRTAALYQRVVLALQL